MGNKGDLNLVIAKLVWKRKCLPQDAQYILFICDLFYVSMYEKKGSYKFTFFNYDLQFRKLLNEFLLGIHELKCINAY